MTFLSQLLRPKRADHKPKRYLPDPSQLPNSSGSFDACKTARNSDHLNQCAGCTNVDIFIKRKLSQHSHESDNPLSIILHRDFKELDKCAHKCQICRVFRQALVLGQTTTDGVKALMTTLGAVIIRWTEIVGSNEEATVVLTVGIEGFSGRSGIVNLRDRNDVMHLALSTNALHPMAIAQVKEWLSTCRHSHTGQCDNLRWSNEKPRVLVELLSVDSIRLRENQSGEYVALSYCWGLQMLSKAERLEVERSKTMLANLDQRRHPFSTHTLPATLRDALRMIHALGISFAWIDSLCVVQDDMDPAQNRPKGVETMHLVYSNALFTLCALATTRATESLLDTREAWTLVTEPCRLGRQWLTASEMSLQELRMRSPLANRAWTLQEEKLSPRILYVSSDRLHWSCAKGHEKEMRPTYGGSGLQLQTSNPAASHNDHQIQLAQHFLLACYSDKSDLSGYWADIVKSYASRSMSVPTDRLTALSGVAAKYLSASPGDEYLAGLWAKHFPRGLAWRVRRPVEIDRSNLDLAALSAWPSWSWAVLPPQTSIETVHVNLPSPIFRIVDGGNGQKIENSSSVSESISRGEQVKTIRVYGRTRPIWKPSSLCVDWSIVTRVVDEDEKFVFENNPGQDMHAIDFSSGRILVYEARKREIVVQLDFQMDVKELRQSRLKAFETATSTMLLLQDHGEEAWRRIGVAWGVRENYFALAQPETLTLH